MADLTNLLICLNQSNFDLGVLYRKIPLEEVCYRTKVCRAKFSLDETFAGLFPSEKNHPFYPIGNCV